MGMDMGGTAGRSISSPSSCFTMTEDEGRKRERGDKSRGVKVKYAAAPKFQTWTKSRAAIFIVIFIENLMACLLFAAF